MEFLSLIQVTTDLFGQIHTLPYCHLRKKVPPHRLPLMNADIVSNHFSLLMVIDLLLCQVTEEATQLSPLSDRWSGRVTAAGELE